MLLLLRALIPCVAAYILPYIVSLIFGTVIPTSFNILMEMFLHLYTIVLCSELSNPANGAVIWTGLTTGSNAVYTCNTGYQLSGERIRTCMSNGMWSGQEPTCRRMKINY